MTIRIRPARPDDAAALPAVERASGELFRAVPGLAWIADDTVMEAHHHSPYILAGSAWVALSPSGEPIGFLTGEWLDDILHIWQMAVHPSFQRQGVGQRLIAAALMCAKEKGKRRATLTTFRALPWNEAFYAYCGFATLEASELDERLKTVLAEEIRHGIPGEKRCAMSYDLSAPTTLFPSSEPATP